MISSIIKKMLKKIKQIIKENRDYQINNQNILREINWANIFHDSIRDKKWLEELSLNIGRWAGGYPFFYVLNRILQDYKPKSILELGLGESSKFISTYLENELTNTIHLIIEQDIKWKDTFSKINVLSERSKIVHSLVKEIEINEIRTSVYDNLEAKIDRRYDLYVIDGPIGSKHYSRYDIVNIAKEFNSEDEFIIVFDDYNRIGEKETIEELFKLLKKINVKYYTATYTGVKEVLIIATQEYKYIETL